MSRDDVVELPAAESARLVTLLTREQTVEKFRRFHQ
jgi:hypothetical protein